MNIFKNIKILDFTYCEFNFDISESTYKINLPFLQILHINKSSYLRCFIGLKSLSHIYFEEVDKVDEIEKAIDPSKLYFLSIGENSKTSTTILLLNFLKPFTNLRDLRTDISLDNEDYEMFLPQMKALKIL